jgi:hypothetical protein
MPTLGLLFAAALPGCGQESARLSPAETLTCASERLEGHVGTLSLTAGAISYSYESANGPAKVIVTFDARHRPVSTFFQSAPHGAHEELMEAARAIKDCAEYGRALGRAKGGGEASRLGL